MESFNNFIKDKFNADLPEAPERLQWDAMKSGILTKLDEETPAPAKKRWFVKGGVAIIALLMIGLVICNYVTKEEDEKSSIVLNQTNLNQSKTLITSNAQESINIEKQVQALKSTKNAPLSMNSTVVQEETNSVPEAANSNNLDSGLTTEANNKSYTIEHSTAILASEDNQKSTQGSPVLNAETSSPLVNDSNLSEVFIDKSSSRNSLETVESLNKLNTAALAMGKLKMTVFNGINDDGNKTNIGRLMLNSAYVFWKPNHGNSAVDQRRNDLETPVSSFQTSLNYQFEMSKKWARSAGLEYQSLASRFNYENVSDIQVLQEDVVKEIEINYVTKDSSFIYGDSLVNARATRKVVHYNSSTLINVPIYVYKSWNRGPWAFEWSGGTVINIFSDSKGRTISATEEVQDYAKSSNPLYKSWKGFAVSTGISMVYKFNSSANIGMRIEGRTYVSNWNVESGNTTRPYMVSAGVFGRYNF